MGLKLVGEVSLDGSGFEAGLNKLEHAAGHFGDTLKDIALEAFGVYTIEQAFAKTLETAKELVNESKRLGISVEALQVLRQAAKESNVEMTALAKAFEKIDVAREKALGNTKEGKELLGRFAQLGISEADLRSKKASELFMGPLHEKVLNTSPETIGPALKEIMGKGFGELIPVMATNFDELAEHMHKLGMIMSTETAYKLKLVSDQMELLGQLIIATLAPAIVVFVESLIKGMSTLLHWIDQQVGNDKPKPGEPAQQPGSGGGSFLGKAGAGILGVGTGLLWGWNEAGAALGIPGAKEKADERFAQTQNLFGMAGLSGGLFDKASDNLVKRMNTGERGLGKQFDDMVQETLDRLKFLSEPGPKPTFDKNPDEAVKSEHYRPMMEDSMVRVGNFLGASSSTLEMIGYSQVELLKALVDNTRPRRSYGQSDDTGVPP